MAIMMLGTGLRWVWVSLVPGALSAGLLGLVLVIYTRWRPDARLAAFGSAGAYLIVYTHIGASLSYALVATNLPLLDAQFDAIDQAMSLDWTGYLTWTVQYPAWATALRWMYFSSLLQTILVVFVLVHTNHLQRLRAFLLLFVMTSLVVVVLSGLLPAVGAIAYLAPPPALRGGIGLDAGTWHLDQFTALRDGRLNLIDFRRIQGLVTFPSFHSALAVICAWGFWAVPWWRWPMAALCVGILLATPLLGGHYFVDVWAGVLIAWIGVACVHRWINVRT
jgi:membrane-associated phospholipid phosphatase